MSEQTERTNEVDKQQNYNAVKDDGDERPKSPKDQADDAHDDAPSVADSASAVPDSAKANSNQSSDTDTPEQPPDKPAENSGQSTDTEKINTSAEESASAAGDGKMATIDSQATVANHKKVVKVPSATDKIKILLKPAGATPALTRDKWNVTRDKTIGSIANFVKKPLKMEGQQTLFIYVKQTFAPSADVQVGKLYDCFGSDGQLVLHYCMTEAWG